VRVCFLTLLKLRAASYFSLGKHGKCRCFAKVVAYVLGSSAVADRVNFPFSKLISTPVLSRESIPMIPAASVGRGPTKKVWSNFRPPNVRVTNCWPSMFTISPVTPYGFRVESLITLRETPGWRIDTLDPVSTIRRLARPSISSATEGASCSKMSDTVGLSTTFLGLPP
jgi:hypothetical protein